MNNSPKESLEASPILAERFPLVSVGIPTYNRKEKLVRLLNSILESNYPKDKLEIIVVDDASTDGTYEVVKRKFPQVRIIQNKRELLVSGSRNVCLKNAKGKYIFLIDDDNIVDKNCILELVGVMERSSKIGIVAPIMYYLKQPKRVWCAGVRRNMITSLTKYIGRDEIDCGQFRELIESADFPNAFMIKREIITKVGLFNEKDFPIHYEEADFCERARRVGYKVVCHPKAKVWHDVPLSGKVKDKGVINELRAYYAARNRILFHKKYSEWWKFLIFVLMFNWLIMFHYLAIILFRSKKSFKERMKIIKSYLKGVLDGLVEWRY